MRRPLWIVLSVIAVALTAYLLARPAAAPADPNDLAPTDPPNAPAAQVAGVPEVGQSTNSATSPQLPITQVVLYSSGVGYFQRDGQVDGTARVDLAFPTQDVNDLLKSMVLEDLGGGHVSAVSFDSQDPVAKTLGSFAINLADNPSYAQILNQARGEKVEIVFVTRGQEQAGAATLQGTIVGVEVKAAAGKVDALTTSNSSSVVYYAKGGNQSATPATADMLNLWCGDGMRSVPLAEVQRVRFQNPTVETEVQRALQVLASAHDTEKKAVSLHFSGTGKRAVRVGYVVETPLWRTTYRLVIGKDGKLAIQGWAMVQNPSNEDWKDVRMALVSGRPISFKMDLYQPLYVPRPVVQPELYASVRPTTHNGAQVQIGNGVLAAGASATPMRAGTPALPQAPAMSAVNKCKNTEFDGTLDNDPGPLVSTHTPWAVNQQQIDLTRGIVAASQATDLGDSFQYAIEHFVTIARQKSALLPIVNKALAGDKVSLYSPQVHAKYPLLALRMKNTSGVHLMQGPVTVFEGNGYAGDAQLPDLQPNEERLVSYALDLGTEVNAVPTKASQRLVSIRLHKGVLSTTTKVGDGVTYTIKNRSPHDRVILVEHPIRPGYKLVSKDQPKERARNVYRFEHKIAAGKTIKFEVAEEQDLRQESAIAGCNLDTIRYLLQYEFEGAQVKAALEKVLQLQDNVSATRQELAGVQQELSNITRDQERLRANLKEMPATADAYKRYLAKFDSQETTIEKLQAQVKELQARQMKLSRECEAYFAGLNVEATIRKAPPAIVEPPNPAPILPNPPPQQNP
jgi:hypothetical protein